MGVHGPGESVDRIVGRPIASHLLAVPVLTGSFGAWQERRTRANLIGYVLTCSSTGGVSSTSTRTAVIAGKRRWLRTGDTSNTAVAWMVRREAELHAFNSQHDVEPDTWPL